MLAPAGTGEELKTKLVGCIVHGEGFLGSWCYPKYEGGPSLICTILHSVIKYVQSKNNYLPPVLLIQADNCARENKNRTFLAFCGYLVHAEVFVSVEVSFLLVGHTHSVIDQRFSHIFRTVKSQNIYTVDDMVESINHLFTEQGWVHYVEVPFTADFTTYFENSITDLKGHGTCRDKITGEKKCLHSVRVFKQGNRIVVMYKQFEQGGPWVGHWATDEPLPLFLDNVNFPATIVAAPVIPIDNLDKVEMKINLLFNKCPDEPRDRNNKHEVKKVHAKHWWNQFLQAHPKPTEEDVSLPLNPDTTWIQPVNAWPENIIQEADAILKYHGDPVSSDIPDHVKQLLSKIPESESLAEKDRLAADALGPVSGRAVFMYIGNDRSPNMDTFNPVKDVRKGQICVVLIRKAESTYQRGWEVAHVDSDVYTVRSGEEELTLVNITYMQPARLENGRWPENWVQRKFKEIRDQKSRKSWAHVGFDVSKVAWASELSKSTNTLIKADQASIKEAVKRCERWHTSKGCKEPLVSPTQGVPQEGDAEDW